MGEPIKIFYSYSHADERMRVVLGEHFAAMRDYEGLITDWHDRKIPPGGEWDGIIKAELNSADIILLLLSRSFINSKYCREIEVVRAMERHHDPADYAVVIPVFLRPCDTTGTPFAKLQGTPKDAKPVCNWHPQDNGYLDATKAVRKAAEALRDRRKAREEEVPLSTVDADGFVGITVTIPVSPTFTVTKPTFIPVKPGPGPFKPPSGPSVGIPAGGVGAPPTRFSPPGEAFPDTVPQWDGGMIAGTVTVSPDFGTVLEGLILPEAVILDEAMAEPALHVDRRRLPTSDGQLFGRDAMFEALDAAWSSTETGVAVLVAEGGTGKSVLVDRWLDQVEERRWDGAEYVFGWSFYSQGSDRQGSADDFLAEALTFFGHTGAVPLSAWDRGVALAELLRAHKGLLILDGLEPLQYGETVMRGRLKDQGLQALLRTLARKGHPGLCLVTSRLPVTDLDRHEGKGLRTMTLGALSADAGADLLASRGVVGSPAQLAKLAARFGGHALALSLLAVYLGFHDGDAKAAKGLRRHRPKSGDDDHARRVLDALVPLLTPPQLAVMSLVGLFDRPAAMDLIQALRDPPIAGLECPLFLVVLDALRELRLLLPHDHAQTLDAHPVVRQYFGDRLKVVAPEAWRAAHSHLFDCLCAQAPDLPDNVADMAPLVQAIRHGVAAGRAQEALGDVLYRRMDRNNTAFMTGQLCAFSHYISAISYLFSRPWRRCVESLTILQQAFLFNAAGFALNSVGRLGEAVEPMVAALAAAEQSGVWINAAAGAGNLSEAQVALGYLDQALSTAERALAHADHSGVVFQRLLNFAKKAHVLAQLGRQEAALAAFTQAEALQSESQPAYPYLYSFQGYLYCDLLLDLGRWRETEERATGTLKWAELGELGRLSKALDRLTLGRAAHFSWAAGEGEAKFVAEQLGLAVERLREAGDVQHLSLSLLARADFRLDVGELNSAADDIDEAREIAEAGGMRLYLADVLLGEAKLAIKRGQREAARSILEEAAKEIDAMGYHRRDGAVAALRETLAALGT